MVGPLGEDARGWGEARGTGTWGGGGGRGTGIWRKGGERDRLGGGG